MVVGPETLETGSVVTAPAAAEHLAFTGDGSAELAILGGAALVLGVAIVAINRWTQSWRRTQP